MFFSRWFRARPRPRPTYRPMLWQLEERITPAGTVFGAAGPATHFAVLTAGTGESGRPTAVLVEAEDAHNLPAFSYQGTVQFSLGTPDANAHLPNNYAFTFSNHGAHLFQVTLSATGSQTIIVTDTHDNSITGSAAVNVLAAPTVSRFLVQLPANVTAGQPVPVSVTAQDSTGARAWFYSGSVNLSSSDGSAVFPGTYQFTPQDRGTHTFMVTFDTTGTQSLKVADSANSSIKGVGSTTVDAAPVAGGFMVIGSSAPMAGVPTSVLVAAIDSNGRPMFNYTGTVDFTSSDQKAVLPSNTMLTDGRARVMVTFNSAGSQTLTATATSGTPPISGHETVTVVAAPAANSLEAFAGTASVGTPAAILVVALDSNGFPAFGYRGTLQLTSSDMGAKLPANYTFSANDHGRHVFLVTFTTPGMQTVTITDTANSALKFTVNVLVN